MVVLLDSDAGIVPAPFAWGTLSLDRPVAFQERVAARRIGFRVLRRVLAADRSTPAAYFAAGKREKRGGPRPSFMASRGVGPVGGRPSASSTGPRRMGLDASSLQRSVEAVFIRTSALKACSERSVRA
jgi:hypothetical protein